MSQPIYSPFNRLNSLHTLSRVLDSNFSRATNSAENQWVPQADITEETNHFTVHLDLPGVNPKEVDITVDKGVLEIKGTRVNERVANEESYQRIERFSGNFNRRFTLPETADGTRITAKADQGVLTVTIPKTEKSKPLVIAVNG